MATDLSTKFLNLQPSAPWSSVVGTRFCGANMADIDNDGRDEVIALSPGVFGQSAAGLGALAYFNYTEMASSWNTASPQTLMIAAGVLSGPQSIGGAQVSWTPSVSDSVWKAPIRDADGIDLLIFDGDQTLSLVRWEESDYTRDSNASSVLAPTLYWATTGTVPGATGQPAWTLASGNSFTVGDIDGDGVAEVVVFSGNQYLAVLKWSQTAGSLEQIWGTTDGVVPGANGDAGLNWNLFPNDHFYIGDIDKNMQSEIVAFDGSSFLGVFTWTQGALVSTWQTSGAIAPAKDGGNSWPIGSDDWFHMIDLNTDGTAELVCASSTAVGVLQWMSSGPNGSGIYALCVDSGTLQGDGCQWTFGAGDIHYLANFEKSDQGAMLVFNAGQLALMHWDNIAVDFVLDFVAGSALSSVGLTWTLNEDNLFTCADVDGDGFTEILVQSDSAQSIGLLKWIDGQIQPLWIYTVSNTAPLPVWGVNLVGDAPATAFTPFMNGTAPYGDIYAQISESACGQRITDIRKQYGGESNYKTGAFLDWEKAIQAATPTTPGWEWMSGYAMADIDFVRDQIDAELFGVAYSWAMNDEFDGLMGKIAQQRQTDLDTVQGNVVFTISPESQVDYWVGQVFVALLWGMAAIPGMEGAYPIMMAMTASMAGSFLGQANSSNPPATIPYFQFQADINNEATTAVTASDALLQTVLTDPVKLVMLGQLLVQWQWDPTTADDISAATSTYNRTYYYQQILPSVFEAWQYTNTVFPSFNLSSNPPWWAMTSWISEMEYNNMYALAALGSYQSGQYGYPSQALMTDLFTNLGCNWQTFFSGGDIALSTVVFSDDGSWPTNAPVYVTNSTGSDVWVTIYEVDDKTQVAHGMVKAWASAIFTSSLLLWGSFYHVRGQVQTEEERPERVQEDEREVGEFDAPEHNSHTDTRVRINPQAFDAASGYAVVLYQNSTTYYWDHVN